MFHSHLLIGKHILKQTNADRVDTGSARLHRKQPTYEHDSLLSLLFLIVPDHHLDCSAYRLFVRVERGDKSTRLLA